MAEQEFIVSARKYRPQTFGDVVGQQQITNTLKNAITNKKIAHAMLFCGPRGVGKTTCARIMAKTLNCQNLQTDLTPCNACDSCNGFNTSYSFNIHELDAASNNHVDDIRSLVEQVRIPPQVGQYSIYIIDEVHMLSQAAFNAFLKTLEEPPPYAIFIMATTEKHKILPTILSRCQVFDFQRITIEDTAAQLAKIASAEKIEAEPDALYLIAEKSDGAMRDALSVFDRIVTFSGNKVSYAQVVESLNVLDHDYYFKISTAASNADNAELLKIFDGILRNGFDGQHVLVGLSLHYRNLLVSGEESTIELLQVGDSVKERYKQEVRNFAPEILLNALSIINQADTNYRLSNNQRLLVELTLLKLATLHKKKVLT